MQNCSFWLKFWNWRSLATIQRLGVSLLSACMLLACGDDEYPVSPLADASTEAGILDAAAVTSGAVSGSSAVSSPSVDASVSATSDPATLDAAAPLVTFDGAASTASSLDSSANVDAASPQLPASSDAAVAPPSTASADAASPELPASADASTGPELPASADAGTSPPASADAGTDPELPASADAGTDPELPASADAGTGPWLPPASDAGTDADAADAAGDAEVDASGDGGTAPDIDASADSGGQSTADSSLPPPTDNDQDGFPMETDCDDNAANVFPGATEVCNGIDDNCDTLADEGLPELTWYADSDGDGAGDAASAVIACSQPPDTAATGNDCDDSNSSIHPGATEVCNAVDDNCSGDITDDNCDACGSTPQLTGSVHDTLGRPVPGLTVYASSTQGHNSAVTDSNGAFSYALPEWIVEVQLCVVAGGAWWAIMQDANNTASPLIPNLVGCIDPIPWVCNSGDLDITLPAGNPVSVHVTSDSVAVAGATVHLEGTLTSAPFEVVPGVMTTVNFIPGWSNRTTNASGDADFIFYPTTSGTFSVTASTAIQGVTLTTTVSDIAATETDVDVALPSSPQLVTGSVFDTIDRPVPGLTVYASNADGHGAAVTASDGSFSFYAPAGNVNVALCVTGGGAWWAIMQDATSSANPQIPNLVRCVAPVVWTSSDGPLTLTLPTAYPITVHVTSEGSPVSGAQVRLDGDLTSDPFDLQPGVSRTVGFIPGWSTRTTGVSGDVDFMFYPSTGTTFNLTATVVVQGVSLTTTLTGISTTETDVDIVLPGSPQLVTGSVFDTTNRPVPGLTVYASNVDGHGSAVTASDGTFSFYAPAGTVDVALCVTGGGAWWAIMQDANSSANPEIPNLVNCVTPVDWTITDGPLEMTLPTAFPITVQVHDQNGTPVPGASVTMAGSLTSDPFDLTPGVSRTVGFIPGWSTRTTGVSGSLDYQFYPSTGTTVDITATATIGGLTLVGQLDDVAADAPQTHTVVIPGTLN